ncbi:hypothetical protein JTB14_015788 [Gonioctena quinquepunctata]|nr:hypothetical protein JTB14_015788 [Gonioctena quinquepunctata]
MRPLDKSYLVVLGDVFYQQTDASDFGLGAVPTQEKGEGRERGISYISRTLNPNERKYGVTEKECFGVLWAIAKFRAYIEATHLKVITVHFALKWLDDLKDPAGRLARSSVKLQQYSFDIKHRRGKDNVVPYAFSRAVPVMNGIDAGLDFFPGHKNHWLEGMRRKISQPQFNSSLWRFDDLYVYKRCRDAWNIVVLKSHRQEIMKSNHDSPTSGHEGVHKTYQGPVSSAWFESLSRQVSCLASKYLQTSGDNIDRCGGTLT